MKEFFRYLRSAFWVRERLPLLGHVPVNALAMLVFIALGFGHPAFWLLGIAGEVGFLWAMVANARFRKIVDANGLAAGNKAKSIALEELIGQLQPGHHEKYTSLDSTFKEVGEFYRQFAPDDLFADENLENLRSLESVYLRLLIARQHLSSPTADADINGIRTRITELETKIAKARNDATRESLSATVTLLQKRLAVLDKRAEALEEIDSDLARIEVQFQLAKDSAAIRARPAEAKLDLDMASRLMTTTEYVDFGSSTSLTDERRYVSE